jgi:NAD-dependent deacetylase
VISFGQSLVAADLERCEVAARHCDLFVAVGTTLAVYPVAALVPSAREHGATIVILNGEPTAMDDLADVVVRGDITTWLPQIVGQAFGDDSSL